MADPARLALSYPQALALMTRWRPSVVFTTGGYVAIPVVAAAKTLRVPSLMWEGNLVPGRSVRAFAMAASDLASLCGASISTRRSVNATTTL